MKILKRVLLGILAVIIILLVVALFVPNNYKIERTATINKPASIVYEYVKQLKNQDQYNKWVMADPAMKKTYRGEDGNVGFVYAWDSEDKNVGKGEQEIRQLTPAKAVDCEIRFEKPFENVATTRMQTDSSGPSTTNVIWTMEGKNKYPFNLMNLFIDGMLGKDLETSLSTLKQRLE
jgi:uncharacterized protein YndB with AHSA1/START domain